LLPSAWFRRQFLPAYLWGHRAEASRSAIGTALAYQRLEYGFVKTGAEMSLLAETQGLARDRSVDRRAGNVIPLNLPREADRQGVLDWAIATVTEAEHRVAALRARIEYLESLSVTDELTGLLNRRGFLSHLDRALAAARRGGAHGVLMVCDLDGFKAINDRHGHLVGDQVLCQVGSILTQHVRRSDIVARLGGDEFAILLIGAHLQAARRKAHTLAQLISATSFAVNTGEVALGISFGLSAYCGETCEEQLMNRADMAMYGQKRRHAAARTTRA
jgi:diguanylate cyclase (GGDEF)-like protein